MKNLIIILLLLSAFSCKKDTVKAPTPAPPPPPSSLTAAELALVGHWNHILTEGFADGVLAISTPHADSINCMIELYSTVYPYITTSTYHNGKGGWDCTIGEWGWKLQAPYLNIQTISYYIYSQTATTLVLQSGSVAPGGGGAYRFHYSK